MVLLAALVSLPAVVWYAAFLIFDQEPWWLFVANSLAHTFFLPVGAVLIVGLISRNRRLLLTALVPTVIAIMTVGNTFVPVPVRTWWSAVKQGGSVTSVATALAATAAQPSRMTVMTYNLNNDNVDADGVMTAIQVADADLVAVQEVGEAMRDPLRDRAERVYPYVIFTPSSGWGGLAVFSRYPFEPDEGEFERITNGNPMVLEVHAPFGDFALVNVHNTSLPRSIRAWPEEIPPTIVEREAVSRSIAEYALDSSRPVLVMGDFNTTERGVAYEILAENLQDAWREVGFGFGHTFPGGELGPRPFGVKLPSWMLRIDYVFHDEAFLAERAQIGEWDGTSDHRPVVVELRWVGDR